MRSWELRSFGREGLVLADRPIPQVGPLDVLVKVNAVSLNYRDRLVVEGLYNPDVKFPLTQVADTAGEVVKIGDRVSRFRVGDRVLSQYATTWIDGAPKGDETVHTLGSTIPGGLADYLVLNENALVRAPSYLSDEEASTLPVAALTAWYSLRDRGGLSSGQTVLVHGTGGVSLFGLQIATALGARVFITSSSDEKLERARALGAHDGINYSRFPDWEAEVLKQTDGQGVDHTLEVVAGKNLAKSIAATRPGGQVSVIGILEGFSSEISIFTLLNRQTVVRGIVTGPRRAFEEMNRKLEDLKIRPVIDRIYSFDEAPAAYEHLYRGAFGKIVIRVGKS
jgi:NADPH:quinone reductase-like Zn-dependent oxidoreductase